MVAVALVTRSPRIAGNRSAELAGALQLPVVPALAAAWPRRPRTHCGPLRQERATAHRVVQRQSIVQPELQSTS